MNELMFDQPVDGMSRSPRRDPMGRPVKKITINDYERGLKFEITDRATIAGLNRITDIIDRMEATAEVMERSGTHPAVLLAASYHEHVAYACRHCPKATNGSTVASCTILS
jgi:hypothetical protein